MAQAYTNAFRSPMRAEIDRDAYSNSLLKNDVARIPQRNAAEDVAFKGQEQALGQDRQANARKMAADIFTAIADAPDPISTGAMLTQSGAFRSVGADLGLPVDQFKPAQGDDPEQIRAAARSWAQAVGAGSGQQQRVQSTQVLADGTIAYMTSDGQLVKTPEKARNDLRFVESGGGTGAFNPRTGTVDPITTATQENTAAADKAGAEAWARAAATAGVDLQKEQVGRQGTLGVWRVARKGLLDGLAGTDTGPVSGRMPAFTVGQQVAEGAVAAVAPVLKALFRSAGEGVFTDRDQQLLIDMIPNRTDHPETIASKMQMIDAIIEAKLSAPVSIPGIPTSRPGPQAGGGQALDFTSMSDDELRRIASGGQ